MVVPSKFWLYAIGFALVTVGLGIVYYNIREGGKEAQRVEQRKVDDRARERIKAVPPADSRSTIERLSAGTF